MRVTFPGAVPVGEGGGGGGVGGYLGDQEPPFSGHPELQKEGGNVAHV